MYFALQEYEPSFPRYFYKISTTAILEVEVFGCLKTEDEKFMVTGSKSVPDDVLQTSRDEIHLTTLW